MATNDTKTAAEPSGHNAAPEVNVSVAAPAVPAEDPRDTFAQKLGKSGPHARYIRGRLKEVDISKPETLSAFLDEFASNDSKRLAMEKEIRAFGG